MAMTRRTKNQGNGLSGALFFIALCCGVTAIILMKYTGADQVIITAVPVAIMLFYALLIISIRKFRLRLDQAGDNFCYFGFLYTLTSLAYSLYDFGESADAAASIITNFGIAIATTIVGLALRVLFAQMRTDPIETEEVARIELADASRRLRGELDTMAREFSMFRVSLQQMTAEAFKDLRDSINGTVTQGVSEFDKGVSDFSRTLTNANSELEAHSNALKESSLNLAENMTKVANRIENIRLSDAFLEE